MGFLPGTGSAISFGKVQAAFTNGVYPRSVGENISLGGVLNSHIGRGAIETRFSEVFGGRDSPQNYPP